MSGPEVAGRPELLRLSAALATGDAVRRDAALRAAGARAPAVAVEETILQSHLFLGYPVALNALTAWRALGHAPATLDQADDAERRARGQRVCQAVYGGQYDALRDNVRALHPDMERWMVEDGYGRVLGRPGLPLDERELCIVALLAVLDVPRQLYAHVRGALNVGASPADVEEALAAAAEVADERARRSAAETWDAVRTRAAGRS